MSSNTNAFSQLSDQIKEKLTSLNITEPTKVQEKIIPLIAQGKSLLFQSETGTGKTYPSLQALSTGWTGTHQA